MHIQGYQPLQQREKMEQVVRGTQSWSTGHEGAAAALLGWKRLSRRFHRFAALSFLLVFVQCWQFPSCRANLVSRQDDSTVDFAPFNWTTVDPSKELNWTDCYGRFQCARLTVPLLYSEPTGDEGAIALIKYPSVYSPGDEKYRGPILFNPGGPGGSGVSILLTLGESFRAVISDEFDLVGFDPRGVGFTTPELSMFPDRVEEVKFLSSFPLNLNTSVSDIGEAYARGSIVGNIAADRSRFVAERVSTPLVARDMLSIVRAYGQDKLQYWGFSYGTVLGATFASMFPDHIGRVVLDGVVDTEDYYSGSLSTGLRDTDAALRDIYRSCVNAGPSVCPIYEDSTKLVEARVNRLLDRLKGEPLGFYNSSSNGGDYEVVDYPSVKATILNVLYETHSLGASLASALAGLEQGNASAFHTISINSSPDSLLQLECPVEVPAVTVADRSALLAIQCGDILGVRPESLESVREAFQEIAKTSIFADTWTIRAQCSGWKVPAKERFNGSLNQTTSHPLLFIGNTADPVTPLEAAQKVSKGFKDSVVLTQNSSGHCSVSAKSICTFEAVREYFINGTLPKEGTICQTESSIFGDSVFNFGNLSARKRELADASESLHKNYFVPALRGGQRLSKYFLRDSWYPDSWDHRDSAICIQLETEWGPHISFTTSYPRLAVGPISMSTAVNGWHRGERSLRDKLEPGFTTGWVSTAYTMIDASMPEQHREFYMRNVPFIPLTIKDSKGRPWASLISGTVGKASHEWVNSPSETELVMELEMWEGDPMLDSLNSFDGDIDQREKALVAGLGIEFPTRRRNKFAGWIERVEKTGSLTRRIYLRVNQAIGNCPKYINVRTLDPYPDATPEVIYNREMTPEDRLPDEMIKFILQSDTVFFGTSYEALDSDKARYPSHVGMNARSGRPGLTRVRPSDGRTVVLPDYSGNRLMTSLGSVEASSRAAMSFLDFETGSILYLTGTARNLVGSEAQALMPRQNVLTALYTEAFIYIRNALPIRQRPGTEVGRSPYSPPIKFLAEEKEMQQLHVLDGIYVTLARIEPLSPTLATFTFETDKEVKIRPGQAAALDFTDLLGASQYAHMAPGNETSVNDDRIRTWTVSSSSLGETKTFSLTMREKLGGLVTGALFNLTRHASVKMPAILADSRPLGLKVRLVGITGSFTLPSGMPHGGGKAKMLWIAGGIGVTPFLSMLSYISSSGVTSEAEYDVILMVSTREPDVLLRLVRHALAQDRETGSGSGSGSKSNLRLSLHVFASSSEAPLEFGDLGNNVSVSIHQGRPKFSKDDGESSISLVPDVKERLVYLCGPHGFEENAIGALSRTGVEPGDVLREGFDY